MSGVELGVLSWVLQFFKCSCSLPNIRKHLRFDVGYVAVGPTVQLFSFSLLRAIRRSSKREANPCERRKKISLVCGKVDDGQTYLEVNVFELLSMK